MKSLLILLFFISLNAQNTNYDLGKKIYKKACISCHGVNGETNEDMQLTVKPRKLNKSILSQSQMAKIISDGSRDWGSQSDIMPAFKYLYDKTEIQNIALYIYQTFNSKRDEKIQKLLEQSNAKTLNSAKTAKIGKKIFKRNCSLCHGIKGKGNGLYVKESKINQRFIYPYNLTKIILNENQIFLYAKFGGHFWGTAQKDMPSWKKKYNDTKLRAVAKYIVLNIKTVQ